MTPMASPPPHGDGDGSGAVCCMCGDHGLPHELFRCKFCHVRLQHRYCSDLYPRATAYRTCNWCLREPAEGAGGAHAHAHAHAHAAANKLTEKRKAAASTETSTSDEEERQRHEAGCSTSRRAAAELGRPVKKPKADERTPGAAKGNNSNRKLMQAGKMTRPVRVKVRRYKLLAEVISC